MSGAIAGRSGMMTWVSSVRTTMANDPGRQLLEDQIQSDGLLFLEDYLESILARPKLDPIIELVKTPARRRNVPKMKSGTGLTRTEKPTVIMNLEEVDSDKENDIPPAEEAPMNAFHKALLQTKDDQSSFTQRQQSSKKAVSSRDHESSSKSLFSKRPGVDYDATSAPSTVEQILTDDEEVEENVVENLVTPPRPRSFAPQSHVEGSVEPILSADSPDTRQELPKTHPTTELSVIAEADESAELSSNFIVKLSDENDLAQKQATGDAPTKPSRSPKPYLQRTPPKIDMENIMDIEETMNFNAMSIAPHGSFVEITSDSVAALGPTDDTCLSQSPHSSTHDAEYSTAPLPSDEAPIRSSARSLIEEKNAALPPTTEFPTIGPPSPLRKSTRLAKDSSAAVHAPPVTKSTAARSSWLVKAREAKAMEDGKRRHTTLSTFSHQAAAGSKRKSGDILDTEKAGIHHNDMGRTQKLTKITETSPISTMSKEQEEHPLAPFREETVSIVDEEMRENATSVDGSDGMIDKLKRTVAGFSARAGRSMGKSLGGAAATALAEARAAAEAKVAERNAAEGRVVPAPTSASPVEPNDTKVTTSASVPAFSTEPQRENSQRGSNERDRRLSVSDLVSKLDAKTTKGGRVFHPPAPGQSKPRTATTGHIDVTANASTSTTPPNSPPKARPPVFTLPEKPKLPPVQTFFAPPPNQAFSRVEPQPSGPTRVPQAFHSQSTFYSTQSTCSDAIFYHEMPAWVPSTQDTDFSDQGPAQSTLHDEAATQEKNMDANESWHLDEKFGETWTPVAYTAKDDDMTWSTAPTRSTRSADTDVLDGTVLPAPSKTNGEEHTVALYTAFETMPTDNPLYTNTDEMDDEDMEIDIDEDIASVRLVTPAPQSKNDRYSEWSNSGHGREQNNETSNNNGGFFSSASKIVSSVLGGSKKGAEPVKSLQLAAVAAKKQQEEAEKKAIRLKEMEARRQQALQKKTEEDKAREEKRAKEENERWKREREKEDTTEKRMMKQPGKKLEEDPTKKRKIAEPDKKTETKKMPPKDKKKDAPTTKIGKFNPTSSQSINNATASSSKPFKHVSTTAVQGTATKLGNMVSDVNPALGKAKAKIKVADSGSKQPSQLIHSQLQARYHAQVEDTQRTQMPPPPPPARTESIELPDINSEYSDSDDETRVRTFDPPDWAQSPELREALESQKTVNPDDIFGAIRPLKMEELFKNRTSRFRARTSSANWAGTDGLTLNEEVEYARRMGYKQ
ncbi:hypothetical protein ACEPAH_650 [Sanghuangporus vaninii]